MHTLVDGNETPGRKTVTWKADDGNGHRVASGVYSFRMTAPGFERTYKMVVLK